MRLQYYPPTLIIKRICFQKVTKRHNIAVVHNGWSQATAVLTIIYNKIQIIIQITS
jgi:hypothetical protein